MTPTAPGRPDFTPAQHAFIRRQIALIPLYVWVVYAWGVFFAHLPIPPFDSTTHIARDFAHFYAQGVAAREHAASTLYDLDALAALTQRVVPDRVEVRFPPVYGPQVPLLFAPLAFLPYVPAMVGWLGLTIAGYAACMFAVWRNADGSRRVGWTALVFALGMPGLHFALSFGQVSLVALVCFTALWLCLKHGRLFLAGLAVGALAYKPQLGVVAAFVFVLSGERRVVWGALTAIVVQAAAAWAYWGAGIFTAYSAALLRLPGVIAHMEPDKSMMQSWRGFLLLLGLPESVTLVLTAILSLATIAVAVQVWRRRGALAPRYVVLVLATLLVNPHMYSYDLLPLAPALLVAWDWASTQSGTRLPGLDALVGRLGLPPAGVGRAAKGLVLLVYTAPILTIGLTVIPVQWTVLSFVLLGVLLSATSTGPLQDSHG